MNYCENIQMCKTFAADPHWVYYDRNRNWYDTRHPMSPVWAPTDLIMTCKPPILKNIKVCSLYWTVLSLDSIQKCLGEGTDWMLVQWNTGRFSNQVGVLCSSSRVTCPRISWRISYSNGTHFILYFSGRRSLLCPKRRTSDSFEPTWTHDTRCLKP